MSVSRSLRAWWCAALIALASIGCRSSEPPLSTAVKTSVEQVVPAIAEHSRTEDPREDRTTNVAVESGAWAGEYFCGDGLGWNVHVGIGRDGIFEFRLHGCTGPRDHNWGEIVERDGVLHLTFKCPNKREQGLGLDEAFVPIRWGERRYLIVPTEMKDFCEEIISGDEPRSMGNGHFLMACDLESKLPTGDPELPREFAELLVGAPLYPSVVEVKESHLMERFEVPWRESVVTLDVGLKHGAYVDLGLLFIERPFFRRGTITMCEDARCEAVIYEMGENPPIPEVGAKLRTRERVTHPGS